MTKPKSYYDTLGLKPPTSTSTNATYTAADIKQAYRRALLTSHPDKLEHTLRFGTPEQKAKANAKLGRDIDEISRAYRILADPKSRAVHDRELTLRATPAPGDDEAGKFGLETVDLDDMAQDETGADEAWTRKCRCGQTYRVTEEILGEEMFTGEVYVPCEGCSLWLKVLFEAQATMEI